MTEAQLIYTPTPGFRTKLDDFKDHISSKHNVKLDSYDDLHHFSVTRLNDFWMSLWSYAGIRASKHPTKISPIINPWSNMFTHTHFCSHAIDDDAQIDKFPKFFEDARMNYAENLLCGKDDALAVIEMNETNIQNPRRYTWKALKQLVARHAGVLKREGLKQGDVVVLIGGNSARSLSFLLAAASMGCIFASFATDIGEKALFDRVSQLKPKLLFAELQYHYNGRINDITDKILQCHKMVAEKSDCRLIAVTYGDRLPGNSRKLDDLVHHETHQDLTFAQVPFNTPFIVMFSSGTTGTPKGIVHSQGGLMINGTKEFFLHNNFGPQDIHFHFSGIGWTLWNISMGAMFTQCAMVLYDGSPFYPSPDEFLSAIFATGVTAYGGSPRYFSELQKLNVRPKKYATKMHTLLSTGALLTPGTASWLAEAFGPVCQIGFSGGTELCGNFMTGTRSLPCYAGEIAVKELGMDIAAYSAEGKELPDGEAGELVCRKPFPNMPVFFWNDDAKSSRYRKSYFAGFPGVWTHGDLIRVNPATKGIYVLGRSDGVLNPSGVRFGTSDLYNVLASPRFRGRIHDGLAIGLQRTEGRYADPAERVVLFLKIAPEWSVRNTGGGGGSKKEEEEDKKKKDSEEGVVLGVKEELLKDLKDQIQRDLSRRHIPHFFFEVDEIPHNANGKKMEIQVKQVCNAGEGALRKMTLNDVEREMLSGFVRFHDVEEAVKRSKRQAKL